jgi:hypothetical protein
MQTINCNKASSSVFMEAINLGSKDNHRKRAKMIFTRKNRPTVD